jgi:hypothetical protein
MLRAFHFFDTKNNRPESKGVTVYSVFVSPFKDSFFVEESSLYK